MHTVNYVKRKCLYQGLLMAFAVIIGLKPKIIFRFINKIVWFGSRGK